MTPTSKPDLLATIRRLRELEKAATPGEWDVFEQPIASRGEAAGELGDQAYRTPELGPVLPMLVAPSGLCPATTGCGIKALPNAQLIAATRNALPELLDELERRLVSEIECEEEFGAQLEKMNAAITEPVRGED